MLPNCMSVTYQSKGRKKQALGIYIDEFLSWNKHIEVISKKISSGIGAVRKLKPHVDHNTLICALQCISFTALQLLL